MPVSSVDRRNGVVYTDAPLIELILDRVGYRDDVFAGQPSFYDPAVGTGGFWLAAAQRVLNWSLQQHRAPEETREHLITCHVGSEIDRVAYETALESFRHLCNTELFQPALFHADSLSFFRPEGALQRHPLAADAQFDFCVGNPPYIGEKGNKALFQSLLAQYPAWRPYYQGKMDYLYFFILLGISKLKEGGRLGFITTRYWLTADGASLLRREILQSCKILELIDLGHRSAFGQATGQQNLIVILEKCADLEQRGQHRPKWAMGSSQDLISQYRAVPHTVNQWLDEAQFENPLLRVFTSATPQKSCDGPWHGHQSSAEEALLEQIRRAGAPLSEVFIDQQGVISGADKVTAQNLRFLDPDTIATHALQPGDGIFCLTAGELETLDLSLAERERVKPFFKNSHIKPYGVSVSKTPPEFLLYLTPEVSLEASPRLAAHLKKFKPILERKRECQTGQIPWYSLHWPRKQALLEAPAIVTPRRAPQNCFALSPPGYYKNSDITLLVLRPDVPEDLRYFLALLNSKVLDFWMARRGKPKGRLREYYATPLQAMPLRRLDLSNPAECRQHDEIVALTQRLMALCREQKESEEFIIIQRELDERIAALYGISLARE